MRRALLTTVLWLATLACIHVVVNVYFPESAAKGALATLEDELLKGSPGTPKEGAPAPAPPPSPKPQPQGLLRRLVPMETAHAGGPVTEEDIFNRIKGMPEVVEAYQRIGGRMPRVDALRASGAVGEGNQGLLVVRGGLSDRRDQRTVEEENADREVVIRGLARAAVLAQGQPDSDANVSQVLGDARSTFAALRRDRSQPGWWIQEPNGAWRQR